MKEKYASKIRIVIILEMLRHDTDEDNYLSTPTILERLDKMGIPCDRRTLYEDMNLLNKYGYEVLTDKNPGFPNRYAIGEKPFSIPELRILMDAVQASSFITPKKTEVFMEKIAKLAGIRKAEVLKSNVVKFNTTKSNNENIFYIVNEINVAIESGKKVSFLYFDYDKQHNRVFRHEGKRYYVNPLATIFDGGNYYLLAYYAKFANVVHYRIDRMDRVEVVEDQPIDRFKGTLPDLKHHKRTLFGMFGGKEKSVTFAIDKSILDPVFDTFGDDLQLKSMRNGRLKFKADVQLSPAFYGWCSSFGDKLEIKAPQSAVSGLKKHIQTVLSVYNNE